VRPLLLVLFVILATSGCVTRFHLRAFPRCADQLPVKVLVDPSCPPDGICGYSCLPDRWKERP
jgi:hypothetical protein